MGFFDKTSEKKECGICGDSGLQGNQAPTCDIRENIEENNRQLAFDDKVSAEPDTKKKLALYEEEYARVKDNPKLAEYAAFINRQIQMLQYVCMTPEEQAAKLAQLMRQKQESLMREAGVPEETIAATSAAFAAGAESVAKASQTQAKPSEGGTNKCPSCNAEGQNGKFCEFCGTKLR